MKKIVTAAAFLIMSINSSFSVETNSISDENCNEVLCFSNLFVEGKPYAPREVNGSLCFDVKWFTHKGNPGKNFAFKHIATWKVKDGLTVEFMDETPETTEYNEMLLGALFDQNGCQIMKPDNSFKYPYYLVLTGAHE